MKISKICDFSCQVYSNTSLLLLLPSHKDVEVCKAHNMMFEQSPDGLGGFCLYDGIDTFVGIETEQFEFDVS